MIILPAQYGTSQISAGPSPTAQVSESDQIVVAPPNGQLYHAVYPGGPSGEEDDLTPDDLRSYEQLVGKSVAWVYFSHNGYKERAFPLQTASWIRDAGSVPYIRLRAGWMYLRAVLDWYSRYVVSWELDLTLGIGFVLSAMQAALATATPTICNSDQGSHFTCPHYTDLLREAQVQISMDGKGRALDNIFTERLWRTVTFVLPVTGASDTIKP